MSTSIPGGTPHESAQLPTAVAGIGVLFVAVCFYFFLSNRITSERRETRVEDIPPAPPRWPAERGGVRVISGDFQRKLEVSLLVRDTRVTAKLERGASQPPRLRLSAEVGPTSAFLPFECKVRGRDADDEDTFLVDDPALDARFVFRGDPKAFAALCGVQALTTGVEVMRITWNGKNDLCAVYTLVSFADPAPKDEALAHFVSLAERIPKEAYRG